MDGITWFFVGGIILVVVILIIHKINDPDGSKERASIEEQLRAEKRYKEKQLKEQIELYDKITGNSNCVYCGSKMRGSECSHCGAPNK